VTQYIVLFGFVPVIVLYHYTPNSLQLGEINLRSTEVLK